MNPIDTCIAILDELAAEYRTTNIWKYVECIALRAVLELQRDGKISK